MIIDGLLSHITLQCLLSLHLPQDVRVLDIEGHWIYHRIVPLPIADSVEVVAALREGGVRDGALSGVSYGLGLAFGVGGIQVLSVFLHFK